VQYYIKNKRLVFSTSSNNKDKSFKKRLVQSISDFKAFDKLNVSGVKKQLRAC
jgi:hypothetical protein